MTGQAGRVPYGWKAEGGQRVEVPEQTAVIKEILHLHRSGWTFTKIAADLNERAVPTQRGGKWYVSSVSFMIRANSHRFPAT